MRQVKPDGTIIDTNAPSSGGGAGTPASSVVSETSFGQSSAVGSSTDYARADHSHGTPAAPTSVAGNAGTATALQTARNIDGQSFDGTADITVIAPATHAATSKATPVDGDELPLVDSAASNVLKKLTWANLKATLKTYFDTLYQAALAYTAADAAYMPAFARVTGSNATTSSTSLVAITGLSVPLLANSVYYFTASLTGNGADANGVRFGVNFSAAGASVEAGVIADTAGTGTRTRRINALNTATAQAFFTSVNDVYATIQGIVVTGVNPGNLTIQHLKVTSGTSTIYINSCLWAIKTP